MAGVVSVHGNEGQFDPVPDTVPVRPIHSDARLSLLGIFSMGTIPFPPKILYPHPFPEVVAGSSRYRELTNPLPVPWGGGVNARVPV